MPPADDPSALAAFIGLPRTAASLRRKIRLTSALCFSLVTGRIGISKQARNFSRRPDSDLMPGAVVGRVTSSARRRVFSFFPLRSFVGFPTDPPGRFSSSLPPLFAPGCCAAILIFR
jgi:hypothetical protein